MDNILWYFSFIKVFLNPSWKYVSFSFELQLPIFLQMPFWWKFYFLMLYLFMIIQQTLNYKWMDGELVFPSK